MGAPRSTTRDLERYAGLFARRTQTMKSSAMRDLMAVTAQPEVISLAGGLPDTSTFPAEDFAALMARVAVDSSRRGAAVRADRGPRPAEGVHRQGDGGRGDGDRAGRDPRHHRRPAGDRPRLQDAARPRRRRDRRGADLPGRGAGVRLLPGGRRADRARRARHARRPDGGGAGPARRRGPRAEVHLHRPVVPEPGRGDAVAGAAEAAGRGGARGASCSCSRTTRTGCCATRATRSRRCTRSTAASTSSTSGRSRRSSRPGCGWAGPRRRGRCWRR